MRTKPYPYVVYHTMVIHVDQTWNSLLKGLEQIEAAFDELEVSDAESHRQFLTDQISIVP